MEHIARHSVAPAEAEQVVLNEPIDLRFEVRDGEERIAQVGATDAGKILVVITTMRGDRIRVVTANSGEPKTPGALSGSEGRFW